MSDEDKRKMAALDHIIYPPAIISQEEIDKMRAMTFDEIIQHNYRAVKAIRKAQRKFDRTR